MPRHKKAHLSGAGRAMWETHKQKGGSWGSFIEGIKKAGRTVYDRAIKPAYQYVRDKPLTTLATGLKFVPGVGSTLAKPVEIAANLTGKGRRRRRKPAKQAGGSGISLHGL
jgi:hypothetical protein